MATLGPNFPASVVNDSTIPGMSWTEPGRATVDDSVSATAAAMSSQLDTNYLKATAFGFAIPSTATINGIKVEWDRAAPTSVVDKAVRIVKGGVIGSTDKSAGAWSPTDGYKSYGGAADLWGETWTPAQINAADFGCAISATLPAFIAANVDAVRVTITYTEEDESSSSSSLSSSSSSSLSSSSSSSSSSTSSQSVQDDLTQFTSVPGSMRPLNSQQRCRPKVSGVWNLVKYEAPWLLTSNVRICDDKSAIATFINSTTEARVVNSNLLIVQDFGFAIPETATITGIEVFWDVAISEDVGYDLITRLIMSGDRISPLDATKSIDPTSDLFAFQGFGGKGASWGKGWTPAEINNTSFGAYIVGLMDVLPLDTVQLEVNCCCITVWYRGPKTDA